MIVKEKKKKIGNIAMLSHSITCPSNKVTEKQTISTTVNGEILAKYCSTP